MPPTIDEKKHQAYMNGFRLGSNGQPLELSNEDASTHVSYAQGQLYGVRCRTEALRRANLSARLPEK